MLHDCFVNTHFGRVGIRGFPKLEGFESHSFETESELQSVFEYLKGLRSRLTEDEGIKQTLSNEFSDSFEPHTSLRRESIEGKALRALLQESYEDSRDDFEEYIFSEKAVAPGEVVTVIGKFAKQDSSIVPFGPPMLRQIIVMKGEPSNHLQRYLVKAAGSLFAIVLFSAVAIGPAFWWCGSRLPEPLRKVREKFAAAGHSVPDAAPVDAAAGDSNQSPEGAAE